MSNYQNWGQSNYSRTQYCQQNEDNLNEKAFWLCTLQAKDLQKNSTKKWNSRLLPLLTSDFRWRLCLFFELLCCSLFVQISLAKAIISKGLFKIIFWFHLFFQIYFIIKGQMLNNGSVSYRETVVTPISTLRTYSPCAFIYDQYVPKYSSLTICQALNKYLRILSPTRYTC